VLRSLLALALLAAAPVAVQEEPEREPAPASARGGFRMRTFLDLLSLEHGDGGSELHLLKIPGFELLEVVDAPPERYEFELLDAPFITLFGRRRDGRWSRTQVLDIPFLTVFEQEYTDDESWTTNFLGLPILGSFYRRERDPDRDRRQFLYLIRIERERIPAVEP
jgi:hypothetical protein